SGERHMKAYRATRAASGLLGTLALVAGLGLAGCSDVDNALFGSGEDNDQASASPGTLDSNSNSAPAESQAQSAAPTSMPARSAPPPVQTAQAEPQPAVESGTLPEAQPMAQAPTSTGGTGSTITPVQIEQGSNTGTAVSNTIANLRSQVMGIEDHIAANA